MPDMKNLQGPDLKESPCQNTDPETNGTLAGTMNGMGESKQSLDVKPEKPEVENLLVGKFTTEEEREARPNVPWNFPAAGIVCAIACGFFSLMVKTPVKFVPRIHPLFIQVVEGASAFVLVLLYHVVKQRRPGHVHRAEIVTVLLGAFLAAGRNALMSVSVSYVPLADAVFMMGLTPFMVMLLSRVILKEPIAVLDGSLLLPTLVGVILILRPPFIFGDPLERHVSTWDRLKGTMFGSGAALSQALFAICSRSTRQTSQFTIVLITTLDMMIVGGAYCLATRTQNLPTLPEVAIMMSGGLAAFLVCFLSWTAFRLEKAGPVTLAQNGEFALAALFQVVVLQKPISWSSLLGMVCILSCVLLLGFSKWYRQDPQMLTRFKTCCVRCRKAPSDSKKDIPEGVQLTSVEV